MEGGHGQCVQIRHETIGTLVTHDTVVEKRDAGYRLTRLPAHQSQETLLPLAAHHAIDPFLAQGLLRQGGDVYPPSTTRAWG